jgi:hypothetical protein
MTGFVFLALIITAAASIIGSTLRLGIGPLPTSAKVRRAVLELCPPETTGRAYELGSGWGGLARALARRCPGAQVVAVEAALVPWAFSALVQRLAPLPNLAVVRGSFYGYPLGDAQLLVCYLFTGGMRELGERLRLKPGAMLISAVFALPGREAETVARAADVYRSPVYRYVQAASAPTTASAPSSRP